MSWIVSLVIGVGIFVWAFIKLSSKGQSLKWLWFSLLTPLVPLIIAFCLKNKSLSGDEDELLAIKKWKDKHLTKDE
jgi:hypothetical protein